MFRRIVGDALRTAREAAGLSVRDVAKVANVSFPYVSDVELGDANVMEALMLAVGLQIEVHPAGGKSLLSRAFAALSALPDDARELEVELLERRAGLHVSDRAAL